MCSWGEEKRRGLVSWEVENEGVEYLRGKEGVRSGGSDFERREKVLRRERRLRRNQREKGNEVLEGKLEKRKERDGLRLGELDFLRKLG